MQRILRNFTMNSNKKIAKLSILFVCYFSFSSMAGTALIFDSPNLLALEQGGGMVGFYAARNEKFSCDFLFFSNQDGRRHQAVIGYRETELLAFIQSGKRMIFAQRDRDFDVSGVLYRDGDRWVLQTDVEPAGCGNAMGGFGFAPSTRSINNFYVEKRIRAVGIRTVIRKSYLHEKTATSFSRRKAYLTASDNVLVLQERDGFSYVRFSDPRSYVANPGAVTLGWVRSTDLVNPFPPANKP